MLKNHQKNAKFLTKQYLLHKNDLHFIKIHFYISSYINSLDGFTIYH